MSTAPAQSRRAFTLIELLVVLGIVALLFAMVFAIPWSEDREGQVRGAAEELAAVLRETRTRAMRKNLPYAVVFNITNAPGSSGRILNNRSGGHFYRVIGPNDVLTAGNPNSFPVAREAVYNALPFFCITMNSLDGTKTWDRVPVLRHYLSRVARAWIDEPHVLPRGKVRFLALTDQDNGDNCAPSLGGEYSATYPRPWFGWWEAGTGRLHAWGGYDPDLKGTSQKFQGWSNKSLGQQTRVNGTRIASPSGFYYEGWEGEITGCVNPADRLVREDDEAAMQKDASGNWITAPGFIDDWDIAQDKYYALYRKDAPRPLINADWLDYCIVFKPDGTVTDDWFRLRQEYWQVYWGNHGCRANGQDPCDVTFPNFDKSRMLGLIDRCNGCAVLTNFADHRTAYPRRSEAQREATSFVRRTGFYWITLAADARDDAATFPTALAAVRSLLPLYRVGVSPNGQVQVIRVHTSNRTGLELDATFSGTDWQDRNKVWGRSGTTWSAATPITMPNYVNHELRNSDLSPRGLPVYDTVLPEMLSERTWWWKQP